MVWVPASVPALNAKLVKLTAPLAVRVPLVSSKRPGPASLEASGTEKSLVKRSVAPELTLIVPEEEPPELNW